MNTTACIFSLTFSGTVANVNKYTFTGTTTDKYQAAIIGTVRMLGFMSLKNDDHSVTGTNAAANKRMLKDAIATRAAADTLIASGAVVLMGTWSNGIQVGPGEGFARIRPAQSTPNIDAEYAAPAKKTRKAKVAIGATSEIRYNDGALCRHPGLVAIQHAAANARIDAIMKKNDAARNPVYGPAYVAPLAPPPGLAIADDQDALHVWRSEMDFSYAPTAPVAVKTAMEVEAECIANPALVHPCMTGLTCDWSPADDTDDDIDALLDSIIEREVAA